jgi:hypothetical protein
MPESVIINIGNSYFHHRTRLGDVHTQATIGIQRSGYIVFAIGHSRANAAFDQVGGKRDGNNGEDGFGV